MAFPSTVTTDGLNRGGIGPYVSSTGNVYYGTVSANGYNVRMFKATDPTSGFANVGTDVVVGSGSDEVWAVSAHQVGDVIHVVSKNGVLPGTTVDIRYHVFNMGTDTWTTTNTLIKSDMTLGTGGGLLAMIGIGVRADGEIVTIYNGAAENVGGTLYERVFYARNVAGAWSADIALGGSGVAENWRGGKVIIGFQNTTHFFFQNTSTANVYERTLNSANTLEALPGGISAPLGAFEGHEQQGCYASASAVVNFPFQYQTNELRSINFTSADVPVIAIDTDITGATNVLTAPYFNVAAYAPHSLDIICAFIDTSNDIYTVQRTFGTGWGTPTLKRACSASAVYANAYTRSSALVFGMVYLDSGDHFYDELTLSAIAAAGTINVPNGFLLMGVGR